MAEGFFSPGLFLFYLEKSSLISWGLLGVLIGNCFIASIQQVQSTKVGATKPFSIETFS